MGHNRIDHVVIAVRPENLDGLKQRLEHILGAQFEPAEREDLGVRISTDWTCGIEILSPMGEDSPIWKHLDDHGEGVMSLVFDVEDLDGAKSRAGESGLVSYPEIGLRGDEPWANRFESMRQSQLQPVCGVSLVLAQMRLK